jgi:hypothetical protein
MGIAAEKSFPRNKLENCAGGDLGKGLGSAGGDHRRETADY